MVPKLSESDGPIFARDGELSLLQQRINDYPQGMTVLVGRPQQGKSRLLHQFVDNIRCHRGKPTHVVGFSRATRQTGDEMLRSLQDMYVAWLSESSWRDQARSLWERHKGNFVSLLGNGAEKLAPLLELTESGFGLWRPVGRFFSALNEADRDLKTASLNLTPLDIQQIQGLTQVIHSLTESPIVLIVDALEQSDDPARTIDIVHQYLEQPNNSYPCHFIIAVREPGRSDEEDTTYRAVLELEKGFKPRAKVVNLPPLDLSDPNQQDIIYRHLVNEVKVPAVEFVKPEKLFSLLDGYAGTLARWIAAKPTTASQLEELANQAREYQYPEIDRILQRLRDTDFTTFECAVKLSLLPEFDNQADWPVFTPLFSDADSLIANLYYSGLLVNHSPPSFGHTTRFEVTKKVCQDSFLPDYHRIKPMLAYDLATHIDPRDEQTAPLAFALIGLGNSQYEGTQNEDIIRLVHVALSFINTKLRVSLQLQAKACIELAKKVCMAQPSLANFTAMGLFNTLIYTKEEGDLIQRDTLLNELRQLSKEFHDIQSVHEQLAGALTNTLIDFIEEGNLSRRDALLEELRKLSQRNTKNHSIQGSLALGLFNTLIDSKEESDLLRRNALLDELRRLSQRFTNNQSILELLAKGLFNTLIDSKEEGDLIQRDALLDELRQLSKRFPDHQSVHEQLAGGLLNTIIHAKEEEDLPRQNALLDELRKLSQEFSNNQIVCENLAGGLSKALIYALEENNINLPGMLLVELRQLTTQFPNNHTLLEHLALGLLNTLISIKEGGDLSRRNTLFGELSKIQQRLKSNSWIAEHIKQYKTINGLP